MRRTGERIRSYVRQALGDPRRTEIGLYAANGAYYMFLSLGPLTAVLLAVLPYTSVTEQRLFEAVSAFVPAALGRLLYAVVTDVYAAPTAALGVSMAAELWSGARLLSSVVRGVGELSGGGTGYVRRRLLGAAFTLALIAFILGNLTLLLFGERLLSAAERVSGGAGLFARTALRLRPVVFLAGLISANALLFRYAGKRLPAFPGAFVSAAAWLLFTRLYSWAMERFGLFGVYGSIAAVIASLYWAYISLYILYLGVWLSAAANAPPAKAAD